MFVIDYPYVSDYLLDSLRELDLPVLDTPQARSLAKDAPLAYVDEIEFSARMALGGKVCTNSENGLGHVLRCRCNEDLARQIDICKDKALFRETVAALHPDYVFHRIPFDGLADFDASSMPCPFVVKPTRGFFSLGVHVVDSPEDWPAAVKAIEGERAALNAEYPEAVVSGGEFIAEASIDGEEYAIDVYFDAEGNPVITNIMHHAFLYADDISDRLYYTSARIIETWLLPFTDYLRDVGRECGFRNFATHVEVRLTATGDILPIEANPLRFAGWCVADMTAMAWGFNPYEAYFKGLRPDWDAILTADQGHVTVMVIGDLPSGMDRTAIRSIDYDGFRSLFSNMLELRKIDYMQYPVFAFAYASMPEGELDDLKTVLAQDFSRFVEMK
ncbi:ATP-grasp domain-containing protein [Pseudodesulfovibrio thermohalotolerans]|uniref:ATP-grasp domain-containing protein n=1 Tax=Pseudodesulfovibrio thermohalotolerans TaxID=2880651 RepID=UPI002441A133|nr:ATP-grasp domain-containing protein [Pseudodesulfovibrio thermohalotolerans]WFS62900.1 ATP-grasp domain-containing protein [Pseudodesulfovibrio thermohalotolerans]